MKGTSLRRNDEAEQIAKLEEEVEAEKRQRRKLPKRRAERTQKKTPRAPSARAREALRLKLAEQASGLADTSGALERAGAELGPRDRSGLLWPEVATRRSSRRWRAS